MATQNAQRTETGMDWRAERPSAIANEELFGAIKRGITAYCQAYNSPRFNPQKPVVRLHEPTFGADEINAMLECLLTTQVTMGDQVRGFERAFADYHGWAHGVMSNSGSSANLLAIAALANPAMTDGLRPGDEVIVPALSWSTTVWPLIQLGLKPVIVDIDPSTLNIDPAEIEKAIGPKTRGLMIVPVYGNPCDMDAIADICERRGLVLIEDCCEALGAFHGGKPVGASGARRFQLLLFAPYHDARRRHHRDRRFRAGRDDAHPARPWLDPRGRGQAALVRPLSGLRQALPVRQSRL
ncbi:MAG: hypothetical protein HC850_09190 [Rhodomicrobium sp.]|nr:hypothetical protein [Rhodomicrobium sp.]